MYFRIIENHDECQGWAMDYWFKNKWAAQMVADQMNLDIEIANRFEVVYSDHILK